MGIKNINKFLTKHCPSIFREISLKDYKGKKIAIDINFYLFKYKTGYKDKWIKGLLKLILALQKNNITYIFVYDTKAPLEKNNRKLERKQKRLCAEERIYKTESARDKYIETGVADDILHEIMKKRRRKKLLPSTFVPDIDLNLVEKELEKDRRSCVSLTPYDYNISKSLLNYLGIPFYDAPSEAETLCSWLCCHNYVDAVLSNDTDVLVYGTPLFLTQIDPNNELVIEIDGAKLRQSIDVTYDTFRDFAIMCGCDYNNNIYRIGPEKAYKLLKKYKNLERIEEDTDIDVECLNYKRVREIFTVPDTFEFNIEVKKPNFRELHEFVFTHQLGINVSDIEKYWL
jgi:5'-3' exonuclease